MRFFPRLVAASTLAVTLATGAAGAAQASTLDTATVAPAAVVFYDICFQTTNLEGAGTDAKVELRLRGSLGTSPFLEFDDPNRDDFQPGTFHCFNDIVLSDVGTLTSVDVRFTRRNDHYEWHLAYVRVAAPGDALAFFPAHRWFTVNQTTNIPRG